MAKKKETILDFDNDLEEVEEQKEETTPVVNNNDIDNKNNSDKYIKNASNINSDINNNNNIDNNIGNTSILASVLSNAPKESKKIYDGFYLEEPVVKTIRKVVKNNKDTNKSKLVNDILKEAFKQAGLL